jgi:hypothetical protein
MAVTPCSHAEAMGVRRLLQAQDLTVALDYGQFYLYGTPGPYGDAHTGDVDMVDLVQQAIERDGIAQRHGVVVVLSPHQNNFAMRLRVEVWSAEPPDDLDAWQEGFEASLMVGDGRLFYESPTLGGRTITVPPDAYAARITGRGFVARGWPGSTKPGDEWRVQLWPSAAKEPPRRLRAWAAPPPEPAAS